jgi:surface antigen
MNSHRSRIGSRKALLWLVLPLASLFASPAAAQSLPTTLSLSQYQAGADTGIEAAIATVRGARCGLAVRAGRSAKTFRHLRADGAGEIAIRWSIATTAPTASWRFDARCKGGGRGGASDATAFVFTEQRRGKPEVIGHSTTVMRLGRPTVVPPPRAYRGTSRPRPSKGAQASAGNPFPAGQCTWYAFSRRPDLGGAVYGHAHTWDETARRAGFPISRIPARGTIAVWDPYEKGTYEFGHVAYVERVLSGNRIEISEYNWKPLSFGRRIESASGLAFIYKRGQKPGAPVSLPKFGVHKLDDQIPRDGLVRLSPGESIGDRGFNLRFVIPWRKEFVLRPNTPINVNRFSSTKGDWAAVRAPNDAAVGYYRTTIGVPANTPNGDYLLRWNVINAKTGQRSKAQPSLRVIVTRPPAGPPELAVGDMLGLFRPSAAPPTWYFRQFLTDGAATASFPFATEEDRPLLGDWNGDGIDTVGVFRPSNATWYLKNASSAGPQDVSFQYAVSGDVPVAGDWNGDGIDTVGVFRPSNATWYLKNASSAGPQDVLFSFATGSDLPVVGDWDGDGRDGVGVFRPSTARWYLRNSLSSGGNELPSFGFALSGDRPVAGDWNGDGIDTVGVFRPSNATWYLRNSLTQGAADVSASFGAPGDLPVVGRLLPPP